jgi:hypothetical protein
MLPVILPIQFEQVEGIQKDLLVMGTGMQRVEIGPAVRSSPDRLPIHDDGLDPKGQESLDYPRILPGPMDQS